MRMSGGIGCAAFLALGGCMDSNTAGIAPSTTPLTMPPADGRDAVVKLDVADFVVNRQARGAPAQVGLRVTRLDGRDLDYSEGRVAKRAADAYCAGFNRSLDPAAMGRFSLPNAWVFDGDCR